MIHELRQLGLVISVAKFNKDRIADSVPDGAFKLESQALSPCADECTLLSTAAAHLEQQRTTERGPSGVCP